MSRDYSLMNTSGFMFTKQTKHLETNDQFKEDHELSFDMVNVCNAKVSYEKYLGESTHENYMALVDIVADVFDDESVESFFLDGQANNPNITPLTTCFIIDLLSREYLSTHLKYEVATTGMRVSRLNNQDSGVVMVKKFKDAWELGSKSSLNTILSEIIADKKVFLSFFRYVFV